LRHRKGATAKEKKAMATQSLAKTAELTSELLAKSNPFDVIRQYSPAQTKTAVLVEMNQMIGKSFKEFFRDAAPWILELKNNRFKVRPGSKGEQIEVKLPDVPVPVALYWHEFFARTFKVTARYFRQLEDAVEEGKKENFVDLYRDATDSTRSLVGVRHEAQKRGRVKPGPEDNPLAELDYKEFATLGEEAVRLWTEEASRNPAGRSNK
jgi:hypothetical protein